MRLSHTQLGMGPDTEEEKLSTPSVTKPKAMTNAEKAHEKEFDDRMWNRIEMMERLETNAQKKEMTERRVRRALHGA